MDKIGSIGIRADKVKVVVFDAFGTLIHISTRTDPYERLNQYLTEYHSYQHGYRRGFNPLTANISLKDVIDDATKVFAMDLEEAWCLHRNYAALLETELDSIIPYEETLDVLKSLRGRGYKVVVCSNLAMPYVKKLKEILSGLVDQYVLSCEVGFKKPEDGIFRNVQKAFFSYFSGDELLMIGDSLKNDVEGARRAGWQSIWVDRNESDLPNNLGNDTFKIRNLSSLKDILLLNHNN